MWQIRSSINLAKSDHLKLFTARTRNIMVNILVAVNMVSSDTCTCIHQHYFSRVIVDLLFFLFVWRRMKPVDEDINSMATKWSTAAWIHQVSAVKTAFTNSSTVTAQMLRPIKETSQLQDSGGGIILAHNSKKNQW